jgi:glyoxylate/hydroxypyruvate reductase
MKRTTLLYAAFGVDDAAWLGGFREQAPDLDIRAWPDIGDPREIDYVFVWKQPLNLFDGMTNLRAVFSLGAGVETLLAGGGLPAGVPLVRMVDPGLATGMTEFVVLRVLHYHRNMHLHEANQRDGAWIQLRPKLPEDRAVGLLGLGNLGASCARALVGLGFDVRGWSRTPKLIGGVETVHGEDQLADFLCGTEILVCLLPLTADTDGLLDARRFAQLPRGAFFVNVGRGRHVVEEDLLAALDTGHVAAATLDVFREEPLPRQHRFWTHPSVTVMPHCAALTQPKTAVRTVLDNLRAHLAGAQLRHVVDVARGY